MTNPTPRHLLVAQLRKDRDQFSFYATNHRAKLGSPELPEQLRADTLTKAIANEAMVTEIDMLLDNEPVQGASETVGSSDIFDTPDASPAQDPKAQARRDAEGERRAELIGTMRQAHDHIVSLREQVGELTPRAHAYDTIAQIARIGQKETHSAYGVDVRWRLAEAINQMIAEREAS